jgi:hypothetical protein
MKSYFDIPPSAVYGYLLGRTTAYRDENMRKARDRDGDMRRWHVERARFWNHRALAHLKAARGMG